jgi:hypothetical protein
MELLPSLNLSETVVLVLLIFVIVVPIVWIVFGNYVYQKAYSRFEDGDWYYLSRLNELEMEALEMYPRAYQRAVEAKKRRESE